MAEPDWNPDTGGRSLAEILREAGIESANRAARRRSWDDPEETGIRQRRAEAAAAGRPELGRRKSDRSLDEAPPAPERRAASERRPAADPRAMRRPEPGPSTAAIPGLRPDRKPGVPVVGTMASGPVQTRRTAEPPGQRSTEDSAQRAAPAGSHPSTGPIPVVRPEQFEDADDLDATPQESALAWLRFAGELIIALAAGVGVYFAATLLWENMPHVAVLLAPLAVTALVTGVGVWRQRQGREPVGPRLLAILVFAGTLLTIAPAAGLLAGGS
ncbi:MAG TPA: hypothetical protein VGD09_00745 [Blastococcus sp.]